MQTLLIKDLTLSEEMDSTARAAVRGGGVSMMNNTVASLNLIAYPTSKSPRPPRGPVGGSIGGDGGTGEGGDYDGSGGGGWLDGSYLDSDYHRQD